MVRIMNIRSDIQRFSDCWHRCFELFFFDGLISNKGNVLKTVLYWL